MQAFYMDAFAVDGLRYLRLQLLSRALRSHVTMHAHKSSVYMDILNEKAYLFQSAGQL